MKTMTQFIVALLTLTFAFFSHAKLKEGLKLYEEPSIKSAIAAITYQKQKLIVIFTDRTNPNWLKVADSSNGKVGWVQRKDLKQESSKPAEMLTKPKVYRYFEYLGPGKIDEREAKALMKQFEERHQHMLQEMDRMMSSFGNDFFNSDFFNLPRKYYAEPKPSNKPTVVLPDDKKV